MTVTLSNIKGLGPVSIDDLGMHGIWSVKDLAKASIADITRVPGFGAARAAQVKQAAADLLGSEAAPTSPALERARSAKRSASDATSPARAQAESVEVLAAVEIGGAEEMAVLIKQGGKNKKSKEKKSAKSEKTGRGKKKDKKSKKQ